MRRIQRDDLVEVRSGKNRGQRGQVREVLPKKDRVVVQGVNMIKRHMRPTQLGAPAGIVERECRKIPGSLSSETRKCRKIRGSLSSETQKVS